MTVAPVFLSLLLLCGGRTFARQGECFDFDGIDDYADLGNAGINLGDITIEAWIKREGSNGFGLDEIWSWGYNPRQ